MNRLPHRAALLATVLAVAGPAAAAGVVKVDFVEPARYTDAGTVSWEEHDNLQAIASHLQTLGGRFLRDGEVLQIDVLDVDLAGWVRPARGGGEVRLIRGGADWPRISLRYSLMVDGKPVRSGTELVADMNYSRGLVDWRAAEPLRYEKKMLERWFRSTFVEQQAAVY